MKNIQRLSISIKFSEQKLAVGELVDDGMDIFFKYDDYFIQNGLNISPFKLPLTNQIMNTKLIPFDSLFGVFNDSLPDGWGRFLLDRKLLAEGILPQEIRPLDRLAYIGENGMGALMYHPIKETKTNDKTILELDMLSVEMKQVYEGSDIEVIEHLFNLGGSSVGARPKILVGYNKKNNQLIYGKNELPKEYEHWIIKFASHTDLLDIANVEYAYYNMALDAGIMMSECQLFLGKSGSPYFGTKRFDRIENKRLHLQSASGLLHDDFRRSTLDYGHLMDAAFHLEKNVQAYEKVLRLAAFNIYSHNRDDHSKNFSFLMDEKGKWCFAPAYDLTFSSSSHGMHSTMVAGESTHPGIKQLKELANEFGVKNVTEIIDQVKETCAKWLIYAKHAEVSSITANLINKKIVEQLKS